MHWFQTALKCVYYTACRCIRTSRGNSYKTLWEEYPLEQEVCITKSVRLQKLPNSRLLRNSCTLAEFRTENDFKSVNSKKIGLFLVYWTFAKAAGLDRTISKHIMRLYSVRKISIMCNLFKLRTPCLVFLLPSGCEVSVCSCPTGIHWQVYAFGSALAPCTSWATIISVMMSDMLHPLLSGASAITLDRTAVPLFIEWQPHQLETFLAQELSHPNSFLPTQSGRPTMTSHDDQLGCRWQYATHNEPQPLW